MSTQYLWLHMISPIAMSVKRLQELGFKESDCIKALQATSGRLEASATWLLENATPVHQAQTSQQQGGAQGWQFAGFEVIAKPMVVYSFEIQSKLCHK